MRFILKFVFSMAALTACCVPPVCATAQSYINDIGAPTYATTIPVDNGFINLSNGNLHLEIPLSAPTQRGGILSAAQTLVYDSRIWQALPSGSWQPSNGGTQGGWHFVNANKALLSSSTTITQYCDASPPRAAWRSTGYSFLDASGGYHWFPFQATQQYTTAQRNACYDSSQPDVTTGDAIAPDSSGYHLYVVNGVATVYDRAGTQVAPLQEDHNGNYFSSDASGNLIDTTGNTPVLVTTSGATTYYNVLGTGNTRNQYTVTTTSAPVHTYFGQSGVSEYSGSITPIQMITLPGSNGSYQFSYDSYGELSSMTLPGGGTVTFGYTNFTDAYSDVNRWVTSRIRDGGTWSYIPSIVYSCYGLSSCSQKVVVTTPSPSADDTVYTMQLNGGAWNGQTDQFNGSSSGGTPLRRTTASYDFSHSCPANAGSSCSGSDYVTAGGQTVTFPALNIATSTTYTYDGAETQNVTATKVWDFYTPGNQPLNPTQETDYTYGYSRSYAQPALTNTSTLSYSSGSPVTVAQTTIGYDAYSLNPVSGVPNHNSLTSTRGNVTSLAQWLNTSNSYLTTTYQLDDAGTVKSTTDANGTTSYGYESTDIHQTSLSLPTPSSGVALSTSATYDTYSGLVLTSTDANSQQTQYRNYDALNRVQEIDLPDGGRTTLAYTPTQISETHTFAASTWTDKETLLDGYGRTSRVANANGQSTNPWYQQDTCYDARGRVSFTATPYQGNGWGTAKVCSGSSQGTAYSYDSFDRVTSSTTADGTVTTSYNGRAVEMTDVNSISKIVQGDALGRISAVCEVSSNSTMPASGTPQDCGLDVAGTGFKTTYTYDLGSHTTTITQGAQYRVSQTDSAGRPIYSYEPERGVTTYSYTYNSNGLVVTRVRPRANLAKPSNITTTTTSQFDTLGRTTSITYDDGTSNKYLYYDEQPAPGNGFPFANTKGRLSHAIASGASGGNMTELAYDVMGHANVTLQCFNGGCGNPSADVWRYYTYDQRGLKTQESFLLQACCGTRIDTNYSYSLAGETTSIFNTLTGSNVDSGAILSNVQNTVNGPSSFTFGNGLNGVRVYDSMGRNWGSFLCNGSTNQSCSGGQQLYGTEFAFRGSRVIDFADTLLNTAASSFGYDDMNRLTSANFTSLGRMFTYTYDRYGNRWSQTVTQGSGPQPSNTFSSSTNQIDGYTYDEAGNLLNDGSHQYSYDAEGNMTQVDGGNTATYVYDAFNHRIRTDVGGDARWFAYNTDGQRVGIWSAAGAGLIEAITYHGDRPVAFLGGGQMTFEHQDLTGTERLRTGPDGSVISQFSSLPFGDGFNPSGTDWDTHHFAGLERDQESGLDHATFRQYSSTQGRWLSPDPYNGSYDQSNPQSFNRYAYAFNNPLAEIDPDGEDSTGLGLCYLTASSCGAGGGGGGVGGGGVGLGQFQLSANSAFVTFTNVNGGMGTQTFDGDRVAEFSMNNGSAVIIGTDGTIYCGGALCGTITTSVGSINFGYANSSGAGGGGGSAPSNATPWYQTCTAKALGSGAASIALDSVAFIPGGKEIEIGAETAARQIGNLKGYRGIVADNYGRAFLTSSGSRLKGAAAGVSLGDSVTSGDGISTTLNVLGLIPGISDISATLSIAYDAGKTAVAVYKCSHP